ncbi:MAG: hypothetical protein IKW00_03070 [Clostridia bacterium]|nr:hypothetical protein [Clostridia bacterium]
MQNKTNAKKNKKGMKPVYMPYLRGNVASKAAAKRAGKTFGFMVMFVFIYLMLGGALTFDNTFLRVLLNLGLLLAGMMLLYNEGANQGETDVGFGEILQKRLDEGKNVPQSERDLCYHPMKGVFTAAIAAIPFFAVSTVFAFIAQKQGYVLGALPSWVSSYESQTEISQALAYYTVATPLTLEDILRVIVRVINFPFVTMVGVNSNDLMYLVDKLSPILCLVMPIAYAVGYLRGPFLRALVHGNIRVSRRKHNRREQKARKERRMQMEKKELI